MKFTIILSGFALASTALAVALPGDCGLNPHAQCKRVAVPEPEPADCGPNPHANCKRAPIPEPEPEPADCGPNPHANCKRAPAPEPADCNIKWHEGC